MLPPHHREDCFKQPCGAVTIFFNVSKNIVDANVDNGPAAHSVATDDFTVIGECRHFFQDIRFFRR